MRSIISLYILFLFEIMFYYFKHLFLLRNTTFLTEKNGILMHLALCTMPLYYLSEQPDVATGREHGSGLVLPGQAAQRKASRGDARQGKSSRCVGQARRERCPLVLKNTVPLTWLRVYHMSGRSRYFESTHSRSFPHMSNIRIALQVTIAVTEQRLWYYNNIIIWRIKVKTHLHSINLEPISYCSDSTYIFPPRCFYCFKQNTWLSSD